METMVALGVVKIEGTKLDNINNLRVHSAYRFGSYNHRPRHHAYTRTTSWTRPTNTTGQPSILGPRPQQPYASFVVAASTVPTHIETTMHTMILNPPDDNWYMDMGVSSHMNTSPGSGHTIIQNSHRPFHIYKEMDLKNERNVVDVESSMDTLFAMVAVVTCLTVYILIRFINDPVTPEKLKLERLSGQESTDVRGYEFPRCGKKITTVKGTLIASENGNGNGSESL
ncbi:hypothetical protein Tco_0071085 [Tanacetum coccineum]